MFDDVTKYAKCPQKGIIGLLKVSIKDCLSAVYKYYIPNSLKRQTQTFRKRQSQIYKAIKKRINY